MAFPSQNATLSPSVHITSTKRVEFTKLEGDSYDSVLQLIMAFTQALL